MELRRYKEDLGRTLEEMSSSAMSRYDLTSELGIYGQLLTNEETRITHHTSQVFRILLKVSELSRQNILY